jgi:hypothetical protein
MDSISRRKKKADHEREMIHKNTKLLKRYTIMQKAQSMGISQKGNPIKEKSGSNKSDAAKIQSAH